MEQAFLAFQLVCGVLWKFGKLKLGIKFGNCGFENGNSSFKD